MRYFLAIILPPLAVLLCGKPFSALLNIILTFFGWIPGVIHALFVVSSHKNTVAMKRVEKAISVSSQMAHRDALNAQTRSQDSN